MKSAIFCGSEIFPLGYIYIVHTYIYGGIFFELVVETVKKPGGTKVQFWGVPGHARVLSYALRGPWGHA